MPEMSKLMPAALPGRRIYQVMVFEDPTSGERHVEKLDMISPRTRPKIHCLVRVR